MVGRYRHVFPLALLTAVAAITGEGAINQPLQAQTSPTIICRYDPSTGAPNPLGMRSFITLIETDGTTEVVDEQLGSLVPGPVEAVLTTERTLIFPNRPIDSVRQLLLSENNYYQELVGFDDPDGFAAVNTTRICQAETVASLPVSRPATSPETRPATRSEPQLEVQPEPRPAASAELPDLSSSRSDLPDLGQRPVASDSSTDSSPTVYDTVAGLADGNYRYVSGPAEDRVYSAQELLSRGGVLFIFRKTGDELMGSYSYIDGASICVTGRVSGNTVSGQAYPYDGGARDLTEEFAAWGPAAFLRVRRTQGTEGERYYNSAILELSDFSQINAGSSLPPSSCG